MNEGSWSIVGRVIYPMLTTSVMPLEEAIKWFCNLGYHENENGITFYNDFNYKKSIEVIRDALKNGELVIKEPLQEKEGE